MELYYTNCIYSVRTTFMPWLLTRLYIYNTHEQHFDRMINDFDCWIMLCVCYSSFIVAMLDRLHNISTCIHFYSYQKELSAQGANFFLLNFMHICQNYTLLCWFVHYRLTVLWLTICSNWTFIHDDSVR